MKTNPYTPPVAMPKDEFAAKVLAGETTAGPLTVFMYKHPRTFRALGLAMAACFGGIIWFLLG